MFTSGIGAYRFQPTFKGIHKSKTFYLTDLEAMYEDVFPTSAGTETAWFYRSFQGASELLHSEQQLPARQALC